MGFQQCALPSFRRYLSHTARAGWHWA